MNRAQLAELFFDESPSGPLGESIYLNWGSVSRAPRSVVDVANQARIRFEANPTESLFGAWSRMREVQESCARFLGVQAEDLFLRANVTYAMNTFLLGVDLAAGAIAVTDLEYGAITNICRHRCEKEGRALKTLSLPHTAEEMERLTEDELLERILSQLTSDVRLLMISHVMTGNGLIIPIERLSQVTRARGIVLAVDGAHGAGAVPLDFSKLQNVDFYGGNFHKWCLGPKGTGFGWVPKWRQGTLRPIESGWTTFETPWAFEGFFPESRFAMQMLSSSTLDFSSFEALIEMERFWSLHGRSQLMAFRQEAQQELEDAVERRLSWTRLSPRGPELHGPLTAYALPEQMPESLKSVGGRLLQEIYRLTGVQVASPLISGKTVVRMAPGVSTTSEQISAAIDRISDLFL